MQLLSHRTQSRCSYILGVFTQFTCKKHQKHGRLVQADIYFGTPIPRVLPPLEVLPLPMKVLAFKFNYLVSFL